LRYHLYALTLDSDLTFPELPEAGGIPDITVRAGELALPGSPVAFFRSPLKLADGTPIYTLYRAGAAKLIDISRDALRYKLKKFGLIRGDEEAYQAAVNEEQ